MIALILIAGIAAFFIIRGLKNPESQSSETEPSTEAPVEETTTSEPRSSAEPSVSETAATDNPTESIDPSIIIDPTEDPEEIIDDYTVTYGENESIEIN